MSPDRSIALITGGTSGIGNAAARALAHLGMTVVIVGRDAAKTHAATRELQAVSGNPLVSALVGDLSRQADVIALAAAFNARYPHVDVLINNAGAGFATYGETADGIERTWALNHLAPFLLTHLLHDALARSPAGRVINVTSSSHRGARIAFDDPGLRARYSANRAYGQSKLANIMFTYELARRWTGTPRTANVVDPGPVKTELFRSASMRATNNVLLQLGMCLHGLIARPVEEGARTVVYLAADPAVVGVTGKHWSKLRPVATSRAAHDEAAWRRLWDLSARMTGVSMKDAEAHAEGMPEGTGR